MPGTSLPYNVRLEIVHPLKLFSGTIFRGLPHTTRMAAMGRSRRNVRIDIARSWYSPHCPTTGI